MVLDASIRQESGGKRSLDDVMRALLRMGRQGRLMDMSYLFETFAEYANAEVVESLRHVVLDGGMPALADDTFAPCLAVEEVEVYRFDVGFDLRTSIADRIVLGVRPDGPAYEAGLRDGTPLTGWSMHGGDTSQECVFKVEIAGHSKTISYLPRGETLRANRVVPVAGEAECESL